MWIIKNKKIFLTLSALLVGTSLLLVAFLGLKLSIDFKGGTEAEIGYTVRPTITEVKTSLDAIGLKDALVQEVGTQKVSIKTLALTDTERQSLEKALSSIGVGGKIENFNSIGPSVGRELVKKSLLAIILVSLAIIFFIAYAFRTVSKPVASYKYGLIAIVTLIHDIAIPSGVFALLGRIRGAEVDTLFVVALLTVLGLSVSDTIVVFDRIRETEHEHADRGIKFIINKAINDMMERTIITSGTVFVSSICLYIFAGGTISDIAFAICVGIIFGTYSSIYVAAPFIIFTEKLNLIKVRG